MSTRFQPIGALWLTPLSADNPNQTRLSGRIEIGGVELGITVWSNPVRTGRRPDYIVHAEAGDLQHFLQSILAAASEQPAHPF